MNKPFLLSVAILLSIVCSSAHCMQLPPLKKPPKPPIPAKRGDKKLPKPPAIAPPMVSILPNLELLKSGNAEQRLNIINQLNQLGTAAIDALPDLTKSIRDKDPSVRLAAMESIGNLGSSARVSAPELKRLLLGSENQFEKVMAAQSLIRVSNDQQDQQAALSVLAKGILSENDELASESANALTETGSQGRNILTSALEHQDPSTRAIAVDSLGQMGDPDSVDSISKLLDDPDTDVRASATRSLGKLGPASASQVEKLVQILTQDKDPQVRASAASAIKRVNSSNQSVIDALSEATQDKNDKVAIAAVKALSSLGNDKTKLVPLLTEIATTRSGELGGEALAALSEQNDLAFDTIDQLLKNKETQFQATLMLAERAASDDAAVSRLLQIVPTSDSASQVEILFGIAYKDSLTDDQLALLVPLLASDEKRVQYAATYAVAMIGKQNEQITNGLRSNAESPDQMLRMLSRWALAKLNPGDTKLGLAALKELALGMQSNNSAIREAAVHAISELKLSPTSVPSLLPKLAGLLESDADQLKESILTAITKIIIDLDRVELLRPLLNHPKLREPAFDVVERLGEKAAPLTGDLVGLLRIPDPEVKRQAVFGIAAIGAKAADAIPDLSNLLDDSNSELRLAAVYALGRIGTGAKTTTTKILGLINGQDKLFDSTAASSLAYIAPNDQQVLSKVIPRLILTLQGSDESTVLAATRALAHIGPSAKDALPTLQSLKTQSRWPIVRVSSENAISRIMAN